MQEMRYLELSNNLITLRGYKIIINHQFLILKRFPTNVEDCNWWDLWYLFFEGDWEDE